MGGIFSRIEKFGSKRTTQVITPSGCHMTSAKDFFVLDVFSGKGKQLGTEAKFADNAGCGILLELSISFVHQLLVPTHKFGIYDCPLETFMLAKVPSEKRNGNEPERLWERNKLHPRVDSPRLVCQVDKGRGFFGLLGHHIRF